MYEQNKQIEFQVNGAAQAAPEKIRRYFNQPGFRLIEERPGFFKFKNKSSFFSSWNWNPLREKSEVEVEIIGNKIRADFSFDLPVEYNPARGMEVWDNFIKNFQNYLALDADYELSNREATKRYKKYAVSMLGWVLLIILGAGGLWIGVSKIFRVDIPGFWFIIAVAVGFFLREHTGRAKIKSPI